MATEMKYIAMIAFIRISNIDISTGNDLDGLKAQTIDKCEELCESVSECKSYVYNVNTKGCWLKDNVLGIKEARGAIGGIKVSK